MLPLRCLAQNYEWGRDASSSEVAQLAKANGSDIDASKPFAELWMGTHPNCPSVLESNGQSLQTWIEERPECLGQSVKQHFGSNLPFLFKVLSVRKALSIQSHPDKQLAQRLHQQQPKLYPDSNHKPEMALALDDFEALCGFCPLEELQHTLRTVPELSACIGPEPCAALLAAAAPDARALSAAFTALMTCEPKAVCSAIQALVSRLQAKQQQQQQSPPSGGEGSTCLSAKEALALRLNEQYPGGDVGVLSCFFLNLIRLSPGQAIYLPANVPHAYLNGELIECMAASDNVIRAGLTPKFKDTQVLCSSLTYEQGLPEVLDGGVEVAPGVRVYQPPFEEFEILAMQVPAAVSRTLPPSSGPRLLLVQQGSGYASAAGGCSVPELVSELQLSRGSILFIPAGATVSIDAAADAPLVMWAAAVNSTFLQLSQAVHEAAATQAMPRPQPVPTMAAVQCTAVV